MVLRFCFFFGFLLLLGCGDEFERDNPTDPHNIHITYGSLADSRDGKTYKTVVIGEQTWMAENLNYETIDGSKCFDDLPYNCDIYGRLYDWETAMDACPAGWHLPSKDEWEVLIDFAGDVNNLKARNGWEDYCRSGATTNGRCTSETENGNGIDIYGFTALPGAVYNGNHTITLDGLVLYGTNLGYEGYWWTATEQSSYTANFYVLENKGSSHVSYSIGDNKLFCSLSVRCLKDDDEQCGSVYFNPERQFCSDDVVYDLCKGVKYDLVNQRCSNDIVETKCGSSWYDKNKQFCSEDIVYDLLCNGIKYTPDQLCINNIIYGSLVDSRDSKTYKTVVIGEQIWMAENLNYNVTSSGCYENSDANCTKYGRLYNWNTVMAGAASSNANPSGVRGICPAGWHLPSDIEWTEMMKAVGGMGTHGVDGVVGTKLKAKEGWNSFNGTDDYGFAALPSGSGYGYSSRGGVNSIGDIGDRGVWWSSTEGYTTIAYYRGVHDGIESVSRGSVDKTDSYYSVRCVKD